MKASLPDRAGQTTPMPGAENIVQRPRLRDGRAVGESGGAENHAGIGAAEAEEVFRCRAEARRFPGDGGKIEIAKSVSAAGDVGAGGSF